MLALPVYVGQIRKSRSLIKVHDHDEIYSFFDYECRMHVTNLRRDVFLVACRVLCAKVVGATSSEAF